VGGSAAFGRTDVGSCMAVGIIVVGVLQPLAGSELGAAQLLESV